jgi:hypothetical protein
MVMVIFGPTAGAGLVAGGVVAAGCDVAGGCEAAGVVALPPGDEDELHAVRARKVATPAAAIESRFISVNTAGIPLPFNELSEASDTMVR